MTQAPSLGRILVRVLIGSLCVAAAAAVWGVLSGGFSDGDWKVILTSLLFAVASTTAAAGVAVRERRPLLGAVTVGASAAAFTLVTTGLWLEPDSELFWRATIAVAIVAVEGSHVSFVLSRRRADDTPAVVTVTRIAVLAAVVSGGAGLAAACLPPLEDASDGLVEASGRALAVLLVVQVLATALAPLLRRLARGRTPEPAVHEAPTGAQRLAREIADVADRIERQDPAPSVRVECERLRRLARTATSVGTT